MVKMERKPQRPVPHLRDLSNFFLASFIIQTAVSLQLAWPGIAATALDKPGLQHFSAQWCCVQLHELLVHVGIDWFQGKALVLNTSKYTHVTFVGMS